jgi:transposase
LERSAALYRIEASIRGDPPDGRRSVRQENAAPLIDELEAWLHLQLTQILGKSAVAGAIRYGLTRLKPLRPYLDDGRLSIDNNAAERGMKSIALGRKNWLFAGSERGVKSAAIAYTLIETAKLNGVDPQAWLTDVLSRMPTTRSIRSTSCCPGGMLRALLV